MFPLGHLQLDVKAEYGFYSFYGVHCMSELRYRCIGAAQVAFFPHLYQITVFIDWAMAVQLGCVDKHTLSHCNFGDTSEVILGLHQLKPGLIAAQLAEGLFK